MNPSVLTVEDPAKTPESPAAVLPETVRHASAVLGIDLRTTLEGFCDRIDLYEHALRGVARESVHLPGQIGNLMQGGEHDEAQRRLNSFKGLSATVGLKRVSGLAAAAAQSVRQGDSAADLQALVHALTFIQPQLFILLGALAALSQQRAASRASTPPG